MAHHRKSKINLTNKINTKKKTKKMRAKIRKNDPVICAYTMEKILMWRN